MFKHIMLPVDGSELSLKAAPRGIALAKALGAKITVITVISPYHTGVTTPITSDIVHELEQKRNEEAKRDAEKLHRDVTADAKAAGVPCDALVAIGDSPYVQIIDKAEECNCDLIVMASHGRRGLDAILMGSETVKVLTHSKIPVLVVR
jgi:nucleotide-binding universal stress UspA family protein